MLKASVYRIAQYAAGLYKMLNKYDQMDQEVDFPDWWQEKIHLAADYMDKAKHYLEFEEKQPALDAMIQEESKFFASKAKINPELVQKVEDFIREVAQDYGYGVDDAYFAIMQVLKAGLVKELVNEEEAEAKDAVDTVTMDVPLFIHMLEFAREDAKADVDLHGVAEKAIEINKSKETLSMQDYEDIIPAVDEPMNEVTPEQEKYRVAKPTQFKQDIAAAKKMIDAGKSEKEVVSKYGQEVFNAVNAQNMDEAKSSTNSTLAEKIMAKLKKPMVKEYSFKQHEDPFEAIYYFINKYSKDNNEYKEEVKKYESSGFNSLSSPIKDKIRDDLGFKGWIDMMQQHYGRLPIKENKK